MTGEIVSPPKVRRRMQLQAVTAIAATVSFLACLGLLVFGLSAVNSVETQNRIEMCYLIRELVFATPNGSIPQKDQFLAQANLTNCDAFGNHRVPRR